MANEMANKVPHADRWSSWKVATVTVVGVALTSLTLGGCSFPRFQASVVRKSTVSFSQPSELFVETRNGAVNVICEPELSEVQIEAKFTCRGNSQKEADDRLAQSELVVDGESQNAIKVLSKFPEGGYGSDSASITIKVPALDLVDVKTSNASVTVDASKSAVNGSVKVITSNGQVQVQRVSGNVDVNTSNSSIDISDVGGKLVGTTSNGSASIKLMPGQQGPFQVTTSNASVELDLPGEFSGLVKLDTSNASISIDDPNKVITKNDVRKTEGTITVGNGDSVSEVKTSNGSIKVKISS